MSHPKLKSLFLKSNLIKQSVSNHLHTQLLAVLTLLTLISLSSVIAPAQNNNQSKVATSVNNFAFSQPVLAAGIWDFFSFLGFGSDNGEKTPLTRPQVSDAYAGDESENSDSFKGAEPVTTDLANPCTSTGVVISVPNGGSIQAAINAANPGGGDTIQVAAGTFQEQLVINKCVTITGAGQGMTSIVSPNTLANSTVPGVTTTQSIIEVNSNSYVTMSNLTVTGPVPFTTPTGYGIFVVENSTLNLSNAAVTDIRENPFAGNQRGLAIAAGRNAFNQIGSLILDYVTITGYQKGGIIVDRTGSTATINHTIVTGAGLTGVTAQNGIQISRGATGTITNSTVSNNAYNNPNVATATGISPFNAGAISITNSTLTNNDAGIYNTVSPLTATLPTFTVSGNTISNTDLTDTYGVILSGSNGSLTKNFIIGTNFSVLGYPADNTVIDIHGNSITGAGASGSGIDFENYSTNTPTVGAQLTANFNRIAGNSYGAFNNTSSSFNAENNFWGCNTGPNTTDCDAAGAAGGTIDFDPYLILSRTTASQPSVNSGGTSTITTNLRYNSAGADTFSAANHLPNPIPGTPTSANSPNGIPVNFSVSAYGTVSPATTPLVDGLASTTFTAGGPFSGNQTATITAQVDNAMDSVVVTVNDTTKPDVAVNQASGQSDPTNVSPVNFTAVFTEVVTGFNAGDVDTTGSTATIPAGGIIVTNPSNDGKTYNIAVSPTSNGFIKVSIPANAAFDPANNGNNASTSTDNMVSYFAGSIELVVDDQGINCLNNASPVYTTIQAAVAASSNGYTIRVCPGTYTTNAAPNPAISITQSNLSIVAAIPATKPIVNVPFSSSGTGHGFEVYSSGVTFDGLNFFKSDSVTNHNLIYVAANNFTVQNSSFDGPNWQTAAPGGGNHVSRGIEVTGGVTGLLITNNTFQNLRQPAYINGGGVGSPVVGTISNNSVTGTKGFAVAGASLNFTGNTFGFTCAACGADIALFSNSDPAFYTPSNLLAISANNDNAYISVQFPVNPSPSGRAVTYVNDDAAAGGDGRTAAQARQTVQSGVNNTLPGGTVSVAAGTYAENIIINRQLSVIGPNAAVDPNTGTRGGEAVLYSAVSHPVDNNCADVTDSVIVTLAAEGVIFKGFTLDGDNPNMNSGYVFNGADINAYLGITGPGTLNPNADLSYNIVKNMGEFGIVVSGDPNASGARTGVSTISRNKVSNVVGYCYGEAIRAGENAFTNITDNVVTTSFNGITVENFNTNLGAHPSATVSNNQLTAFGYALYFNLHYGYSGNGYTLTGNSITSYIEPNQRPANRVNKNASEAKQENTKQIIQQSDEVNVQAAGCAFCRFIGIRLESINGAVPVTVSNSTINPNRAALLADNYTVIDGIRVTNPSTDSPNINITGNSISNTKRGIAHTAANDVPSVTCNNFVSNDVGVYIGTGTDYNGDPESAVSGINLNNNNIFGNSLFGVQADTGTAAVNNATSNYWGAADGPGPVGPGSGDKVTTKVNFTPFLTAPTNCTAVAPPPTVTINQAAGQSDPTNTQPINFTVVFSEPVTGFGDSPTDVILGGSALPTTAVVTPSGPMDGTTYNVAVSGMTRSGTVTARIPAGAANGADGANVASTSTDNTVFYNFVVANPITITQSVNPVNITAQQFAFQNEGVTGSGAFVTGPATPPLGIGSAQLTIDSTGRENLVTGRYGGTRLADISALQYSAYTNRTDNLTITLAFDVDYDLTDANVAYQNRLVYEPAAQGITVAPNTWQTFDTLAGKFYSSNDSNPGGQAGCTQATPCTKQQLLAAFPNVGIFGGANAPFQGGLYLRAGGPFTGGMIASTDKLVVGVNGSTTTFDFEPTPPTISVGDATVTEGNSGTTTAQFTITQSAISQLNTTVTVNTADGSATTADGDYAAVVNQIVTIPAGQTSATFNVTVNGDVVFEPNETFTVNLSNAVNAAIDDGSGTGTITNDDVQPTVSIVNTTAGAEPNTPNTFTVTLSGQSSSAVTVNYATANGTAMAGSDYTATSGTITFAANTNVLTQTITVPTLDDTLVEGSENFTLALSNPSGATITGTNPATGTIADNDSTIQFASAAYSSSDNTANSVTITVTRTGVLTNAATVNYTTVNGGNSATGGASCTAGVDYINNSGTLNFAPNAASQTFTVSVCQDANIEGNETVNLTLSNPQPSSSVTLGTPSTAVLTISDSPMGGVSISGVITQNGSGLNNVTVTLSGTNMGTITTFTNGSGNYNFNGLQSGANYLVTPSFNGLVFEPINRSYANLTTSVTNANFIAYPSNNIPRKLIVGSVTTAPGNVVNVPINLRSLGNENAISFTLDYDETKVTPTAVVCGSDAPAGCAASLTFSVATVGGNMVLVVSLDLPNNVSFAVSPPDRQAVVITFSTTNTPSTTASFVSPLNFTTPRAITDGQNPLPAEYVNGSIAFNNLEADVAPRQNGDGSVAADDVSQMRRFVAFLDTPNSTTNNEFQRADCAPLGNGGDATIDVTDLSQARRYAAGFDPLQPASGPTAPSSPRSADSLLPGKFANTIAANTTLKIVNVISFANSTVLVTIAVDAAGNENAFGFSVMYDPTKLSLPSANPDDDVLTGAGAVDSTNTPATLTSNTLNSGKVGILLDFRANRSIVAGSNRQLAVIRFKVASNVTSGEQIPLTFTSSPIIQKTANIQAMAVSTDYIAGSVNIAGPTAASAEVSGRVINSSGRGVRGALVILTDEQGNVSSARTDINGYYQIIDVQAGKTYILNVAAKSYTFDPRVITVNENLLGFDLSLQGSLLIIR